jgi:hypothetical protein
MTEKQTPFQAHLEEIAKQPDPPKAFRGGLIEAIQENHPDATIEDITEMLDQMGA